MNLSAVEHFNSGNAAFRKSDWEQALACFDQATQIDPYMEPALMQRARCLTRLGREKAAREAFALVLRLNKTNFSAWLEVAHLCRQMGDVNQASVAYQQAINIEPDRFEALLGMARLMVLVGEVEAAKKAFQDAIFAAEKTGDKAAETKRQIAMMMGCYWKEMGYLREALPCFDLALRMTRNDRVDDRAEIYMDAAECALRLGNRDQGLKLLSSASGAKNLVTLIRLSSISVRNGFHDEAIEVMKLAIELFPDDPQVCGRFAQTLAECWRMDEAKLALDRLQAMGGSDAVPALRAYISGRLGDVETTLALYRELAAKEENSIYASSAAMSSLYSDQLTTIEVAQLHRDLFARLGDGARKRETFIRAPLAGRRLRLGMISPDFHMQHPVNIFMQPILREIDRSRFEVFLYFTGNAQDEQTALARARVEHWIEAASFNDTQLARRIDDDRIDVMMDLSGHTNMNRLNMLAKRVAPVQVTYLGYPGSTGVPNIDFMLGDAIVTPESDDTMCSERVLRLPNTVFCYAPQEDYPLPDFAVKMAARPLTFGSFNNITKLTPHTLDLWARIVKSVPGSKLLLKAPSFGDEGAVNLYRDRLIGLGVDASQLEFRGPNALPDMMAEYADIDIALDAVPYNGGTTSLQAMWMGVPIVVMRGHHFVSRMGASFMHAAGLDGWIANDDDNYVEIAVRMASDTKSLLALKSGMRQRLQGLPAWDIVAHTRAFEDALVCASEGLTCIN